jgi:hypothetical protein
MDELQFSYNWEQDNDSFLDYNDQPISFQDIPELPHFDHPIHSTDSMNLEYESMSCGVFY